MKVVWLIRPLTLARWFAHWRREPRIMRTIRSLIFFPRVAFTERLLALLLLLMALSGAAQSEDFTYTTNNGAIIITGYTGPGGVVMIPDNINGLLVNSIGPSAFAFRDSLTSIMISSRITDIGRDAFHYCTEISSVTIPHGVTSIGDSAFEGCTSLSDVTIPGSVTNLGPRAFRYCYGLTNLTIANGVTAISDFAFVHCHSLPSVAIPTSVINIGAHAFDTCYSLTRLTIPNSVTSIGTQAFDGCGGLTTVTIPSSLTNMGSAAFDGCFSLTNVSIADGLASVGDLAFASCNDLQSLTLPDSVRHIGSLAFHMSGLRELYCKGDAPTAGSDPFSYAFYTTVFYLPGTTGWGTTFGGRPTALWLPEMQIGDSTFGVRTNQFGFNIAWASGQTVVVEACTDLANPVWSPLLTNTLAADSLYFSDPGWTNHPGRFYRVRSP